MRNNLRKDPVSAWAETVVIPTYPPPPPDPNPMFLERRVNQGSSGRVYPNPFTDRVSNEKVAQPYHAVFLENEYIHLMILPQIGGRIHAGLDKTNGYDFIYRQHVIKPALIGLFGSWLSGGVEFNWPSHHRPSTFMPVDHLIEEGDDGSRTVWLGEHDPMQHMKGMVGVCLYPGRALLEFKVRLYNRTPLPQTFLWWVNWAMHANEHHQLFFPPDVTAVTDHSRRAMAHFPVPDGVYYGVDYSGVDISWYENIVAPSSYFVLDSRHDFFGGYDHSRKAGVIHVANHHISPGKKLFTWGNCDFGVAWERNLTDADGPYVELMAGVYTDNQPDFSWLQPYETRTFSQFWYPFQQIGPAKNANRHVAVNLEVRGQRAKVGVCATETFQDASVRLTAGERVLLEREVDLAPGAPFVEETGLPAGVAETDLSLTIHTADGHEIIRYAPERVEEKPLPDPAVPPPPPEALQTTEELYLTGLHLEQYRHPLIDPEPYWEEALRRDPTDERNNNALGLVHLQRGEFSLAEAHFRRAIETLTRRNFNPRDGEPAYNLGLALKFQRRFDGAYDAFYKATWSYAWQSASYYALAEIDCLRGDLATALEHLDRSLVTNARNLKARDLQAAVLRRLGRLDEAEALARQTVATDPLDFWSRNELALIHRARGDASVEGLVQELGRLMRGAVQTHLDIAFDYAAAGLWDEAGDLVARLVDPEGLAYPMVLYTLGFFARQRGEEERARAFYHRASQMRPDYCFPARLEEIEILRDALAIDPEDGMACYYLGNLLYDKKRYEEAIENWEAACRLAPSFSIPWRNLGIAHYNARHDSGQALACYSRALELDPHDGRLLSELDQLTKRMGASPEERLARLEQHLDLVEQRDDLSLERATLYNQLGQPQKALDIMLSRRFHPWEGGEGRASDRYATAHFLLGRMALEADDAEEALAHFQAAQVYPENLGETRHPLVPDAHIHYFQGLAREMLGDREGAVACFRQAARHRALFSFATYYQALALSKLGEEAASEERLQELVDFASERLEGERERSFFTSVPQFVFYEDDPQKADRITYTYLIALARLGLGQVREARAAFEEVLALDLNHLGAQEELRRLSPTSR